MRRRIVTLAAAVAVVAGACSSTSPQAATPASGSVAKGGGHPKVEADGTAPATFTVTPGVEQVTVTGAGPHQKLTLVDGQGELLLTLISDDKGQAAFSYIPDDYVTAETGKGNAPPSSDGASLKKGDGYVVRNDSTQPVQASAPFSVPGRDDHPPSSLYDGQQLKGVAWALIGGKPTEGHTVDEGVNYLKMRDGVTLSAMVRFPDPSVYGPGPYPTVIEYSGYDPANPESPQPGSMIATSLGFATVGLNMRGTGCSGGTFDVFSPAQQADGYDAVEIVARQPWVKGNKVGMVGLSYSGISQLYVGSTRPPSLAAITPLSVIEDPWKMTRVGGIYNAGFTKQWLEERDRQAKASGQSWVGKRIAAGDSTCDANQQLRSQNIDFEALAKGLEFRPPDIDARDLSKLVPAIDVPLYLSGAWQDEQTGPRFATMLSNFTGTDKAHFVLFNGHHPDGYAPPNLSHWLEFLQLYVAHEVPHIIPAVRAGAPALFKDAFGVELGFAPDRFADLRPDQYDEAVRRFEADPRFRIVMESGNGMPDVPGAPVGRYEIPSDTWPPKGVQPWNLYFGPDGRLGTTPPDGAGGADRYQFDPGAGPEGYAKSGAYDFQKPTVTVDWQNTPDGKGLSYVTSPLEQDTVIAGPGYADLWFRSETPDAGIEVVLSEITPEGNEFRIQNGVLRAGDRKVDTSRSDEFLIQETFAKGDYQPLPAGQYTEVKVPIFPVAHALRKGSRLRVQVNTPGRDLPLWFFENPDYGNPNAHFDVDRTPQQASHVVLPTLPAGSVSVPAGLPPCPSLRGQPCRTYQPLANQPAP